MDFKPTLNLPDPEFTIPMKADLAQREPAIQSEWEAGRAYQRVLEARAECTEFVLHDGPPYTNSAIHLGTALDKILKDFVVRSRTMAGFRSPYVPGFDNHGLPIELAVQKKLADAGTTPSVAELRAACRVHAAEYIELQAGQFRRLGVGGLWENPYCTMAPRYEAEIIRIFNRLVQRGFVYRGLRPVLWSPTVQSALADTEIVYADVESIAITVKFPLAIEGESLENPGEIDLVPPPAIPGSGPVSAVIWTTTPWTIPANLAVAFHPEMEYAVVESGGERLIVADHLVDKVIGEVGRTKGAVLAKFAGRVFDRVAFRHPLSPRVSVGVIADYVTSEDGTGVVHTAPGHGRDDFMTGKRYGLPVLCPVDERGVLTSEAGEFAGVYYKACDTVVTEALEREGALLGKVTYSHSYPHAERDGKPVIFRATEQWFVSIEHDNLRDRMIRAIDECVEWRPPSCHARIRSMVAGRPDWCVSRQRPWGVGIPVFYGATSGEPVLDEVAIEAVAQMVETEGSDAWFLRDPHEILPAGYRHPVTGETEFRKETDVFDVWFDSGCTSLCVLEGNVEQEWKGDWPADVFFEGSDQHRGWFNVSLVLGMAVKDGPPYRQVVTHGFVMDGSGRKMSKRHGNAIDPISVCDRYGADVLRTWVASVDYEDDMPCSEELLKVAGDSYRTFRNTMRFLLSNLADFHPSDARELSGLHAWVVDKSAATNSTVQDAYREFDFRRAFETILSFCQSEVSKVYADTIKDTMYCDRADSTERRMAQTASWRVLLDLVRLLVPILPHTAEEVYRRIPLEGRLEFVQMEQFTPHQVGASASTERIDRVLLLRAWVYSAFEEWKATSNVKDSQDVAAVVTMSASEADDCASYPGDLALLFKMATVQVEVGDRACEFSPSSWARCDRSRLRRPDVEPVEIDGETVNLSARDRQVLGR